MTAPNSVAAFVDILVAAPTFIGAAGEFPAPFAAPGRKRRFSDREAR
jgi:hypothetical protein